MIYVYVLASLAVLDFVWLSLMGGFFRGMLAHLFAPTFSFLPAILFYPLYAAGLYFFILQPALAAQSPILNVFLWGTLFGLIAYGTYDLTNQATLQQWPVLMTVIDMAWGALMTGAASSAAYFVYTYFH